MRDTSKLTILGYHQHAHLQPASARQTSTTIKSDAGPTKIRPVFDIELLRKNEGMELMTCLSLALQSNTYTHNNNQHKNLWIDINGSWFMPQGSCLGARAGPGPKPWSGANGVGREEWMEVRAQPQA